MKKLILTTLLVVSALTTPAFAGTIDFENMPDQYYYMSEHQNFGNYWAGVNFGPAATILDSAKYGYNNTGYPAHSGTAVLFSYQLPNIDVTFDTSVDFLSFYYTSYSDIWIDAYNSSNQLIGQSYGGSNYGTNSYLSFTSSTANIAYVSIHDSGNYFTIDDFTINSDLVTGDPRGNNPVPEPSTMLLLGGGLVGLAFWRKRKQA